MSNAPEATKQAPPEPSMEDILSSIRRILSDDGEDADAEAPPVAPAPAKEKPAKAKAVPAPVAEVPAGKPEEAPKPKLEAALTEVVHEEDIGFAELDDDDAPPPLAAPSAPPSAQDNVFHLTPDMLLPPERQVLSRATSNASSDVLSQLAKAILDRRDIAVGGRDLTIEGLVREMLRPMLKEWLDRNLPYLIERLVKKEIDFMVNRAERL